MGFLKSQFTSKYYISLSNQNVILDITLFSYQNSFFSFSFFNYRIYIDFIRSSPFLLFSFTFLFFLFLSKFLSFFYFFSVVTLFFIALLHAIFSFSFFSFYFIFFLFPFVQSYFSSVLPFLFNVIGIILNIKIQKIIGISSCSKTKTFIP